MRSGKLTEAAGYILSVATKSELLELNAAVIKKIREMNRAEARAALANLDIGQEVEFTITGKSKSYRNGDWTGKIVSMGPKNIKVLAKKKGSMTEPAVTWTLHPSLVHPVKIESNTEPTTSGRRKFRE